LIIVDFLSGWLIDEQLRAGWRLGEGVNAFDIKGSGVNNAISSLQNRVFRTLKNDAHHLPQRCASIDETISIVY
jgi:hypothetical protein